MDDREFTIKHWPEDHARWQEFVRCLEQIAPEQAPFVLGDYALGKPCYLYVALQNDAVAGFLRISIQPIGPEEGCPPLTLQGKVLTEAKIHAFAVHPECRRQGIGTALQQHAITKSRDLGCYQLVSHSSYDNIANQSVKLALGFAAQPEKNGDNMSIRFLMPLREVTV